MNGIIRNRLYARKRRLARRLDKSSFQPTSIGPGRGRAICISNWLNVIGTFSFGAISLRPAWRHDALPLCGFCQSRRACATQKRRAGALVERGSGME